MKQQIISFVLRQQPSSSLSQFNNNNNNNNNNNQLFFNITDKPKPKNIEDFSLSNKIKYNNYNSKKEKKN